MAAPNQNLLGPGAGQQRTGSTLFSSRSRIYFESRHNTRYHCGRNLNEYFDFAVWEKLIFYFGLEKYKYICYGRISPG